MKTAILCGGKGTRLLEHTERIPKPLVEIGNRPIVWHIMKLYAHYGFADFVLCLGYKGEMIRDYFTSGTNWRPVPTEVGASTPDASNVPESIEYHESPDERWRITFVETGPETNTGGRVQRIAPYVGETFFVTYGDGVANVDISALLSFHHAHGRIATLTAVQPLSQFGILQLDGAGCIERFTEKPRMNVWVNGGFFVFDRRIFDYLGPDDILEREPFERLAEERNIVAYRHHDFWECMDTYKDALNLNQLWQTNRAGWKIWNELAV